MRVHRLHLINFRQHEDTDLRFDLGLTGVVGPNGSGKTTLLEGLAWAIYGTKAVRGAVDGIRRRNAPPRARVEVSLEFTLGPHHYRVVRTLHGAELYQDGDTQPIANSASAVTERLARVLGMSRDEFFNTYFTGQKELAIMGSMTPMEREKFLSRVLGYERLGAAQKRLTVDRSALRAQLQAIESLLVNIEDLVEEEAAAARRQEAAHVIAQKARESFRAAEAEVARLRPAWAAMQRLHEQVLSLESDLRVAEQQVTDGREAFTRLDRELAEALTGQQRMEELRPELSVLPQLVAERERLDLLAARMAKRRETLGQITELRRRVTVIDERLAGMGNPEAVTLLRTQQAERQAALTEAEDLAEQRRTAWVRDRQDAETKAGQLQGQGEDLKKQVAMLRKTGPEGACPVCNRPLKKSYQDVLRDLEAQMGELRVNWKFYQSRLKQLAREPKEVVEADRARDQLRKEAQRLAGELARSETREQSRVVLATEREGHQVRLLELQALVAGVAEEYEEDRYTAVRAELDRLEPLRLEVERLSGLAERAARLASEAASAETELSRREARVLDLRHRLQLSGWSPESFAVTRTALETADQKRQQAELAVVKSTGEVDNAKAEVVRVAERRAERERQVAEAKAVEARLLMNQELDRAFADLRSDLNAALRPDLSDLGSKFLRDLTMGRYTEFELDPEYTPIIVEDGEPQKVLSGGEEDVVSLALRLSISQMIAERAGQPLSLLVLDEIFGSLDEDRRTAVVDLLRQLADRFPQVILITHIDTVRDGFDRVLRLTYDVERGVAQVHEERDRSRDAAA
jgi:exonuclease SbcC